MSMEHGVMRLSRGIMNLRPFGTSALAQTGVTSVLRHKYAAREARIMSKLLGRTKAKRKPFYTETEISRAPSVFAVRDTHKVQSRRMSVLNKVFMKSITELLTTGALKHDFHQLGIEITKISITQNFQLINVYYFASDTSSQDEFLEKKLVKVAAGLRCELTWLNTIGKVPPIKFVRDKRGLLLTQVGKLLTVADTGPESLEDENLSEEDYTPLPEMTTGIYGLDRSKILDKILEARSKTLARKNRKTTVGEGEQEFTSHSESDSFNSKRVINQFLRNRNKF